jgi:cyclic pyranopterin phosphate synthase
MATNDTLGRPLRNLRLSVTDRCNLRCAYCMPEAEYAWLPREDILRFEEFGRLVDVFTRLGVDRVRLTGGEPLVRHDVAELVRILAGNPRIRDLAMTTNGVLLAEAAAPLRAAGLPRVTVSLDTLRPERFRLLTRSDSHARVLAGLDAVAAVFPAGSLKIDTVVLRDCNDDELPELLAAGKRWGAEVRFIEYMDVGGATLWTRQSVVSRLEILDRIAARYGPAAPLPPGENSSAPAERFRLPDGTTFGIIASTTAPFCRACDRSRLTADGLWYLCLYAARGLDLRGPLRAGATPEELAEIIASTWRRREDRGAEQRLELSHRSALLPTAELKRDPHLEMHTRGG